MATTVLTTGKRMLMLFGGMVTSMSGWVYAQALAAQAKTNELLEDNVGGDNTVTQTNLSLDQNERVAVKEE